jgi:hypothetical protein
MIWKSAKRRFDRSRALSSAYPKGSHQQPRRPQQRHPAHRLASPETPAIRADASDEQRCLRDAECQEQPGGQPCRAPCPHPAHQSRAQRQLQKRQHCRHQRRAPRGGCFIIDITTTNVCDAGCNSGNFDTWIPLGPGNKKPIITGSACGGGAGGVCIQYYYAQQVDTSCGGEGSP